MLHIYIHKEKEERRKKRKGKKLPSKIQKKIVSPKSPFRPSIKKPIPLDSKKKKIYQPLPCTHKNV